MITVQDLRKQFGSQVVLDGISLEFQPGKTTAIVGPSGTGKSVLIKLISGLLEADGGEVLYDGRSLHRGSSLEERRAIVSRMGILFQFAALFDSMSVFENVEFPLKYGLNACAKEEREARTLESIEQVGMRGYETAMPGEISIGMRKRVGVARALVTRPEIILFDEPNTGLDPEMGQEIYELIAETQRQDSITGIVISHEIPEVFQVCERVAMLYAGKVQFVGTVDEFRSSGSEVVQQFISGSIEGPIRIN